MSAGAVALGYAAPAFDEAAIRAHVALLHERATGANAILVVFVSFARRAGPVTHHQVGDVDGMVASIMAHATTPNANVYVGLHLMRRDLPRGQRGKRDDIVGVLGLVADMDADTGKAGDLPCEPSFIVETSPGNFQPVFLFASPVTSDVAAPLASALRRATNSDSGTSDLVHVWRIPGTLNWPNGAKIARGRSRAPVAVTLAEPFLGVVYEPAALGAALEPWARPEKASISAKASGEPRDASALYGLLSAHGVEKLEADVAEGERSEHAFTVYEQLEFDGLDLDDAIALVREYGGTWKDRYKSDDVLVKDAERCWGKVDRSVQRAEAAAGASQILQGESAADCVGEAANDDEARPKLSEPTIADPFAFEAAGGLIGDIARWIYDTSPKPIREFAITSATAFLAALYGRRRIGPTGSGLNVYLVMCAPAAFGKNRPLKAPEAIAKAICKRHIIGPNNVTGDSAIERALRESPSHMMLWDEFGIVLQSATGRNAQSWTATIRRALLELYSCSAPDESWRAKIHADAKTDQNQRIQQPTLTVLGATTPETFYEGLSSSSVTNGLLNRLVVIAVSARPVRNPHVPAIPKVPDDLVERLKEATWNFPVEGGTKKGNVSGLIIPSFDVDANLVEVPYADDDGAAFRHFEALVTEFDDIIEADPPMNDVVGRAAENVIKLATIRAISRSPAEPKVAVEDVEWGHAVVHHSIYAVTKGIEHYMAGSAIEALRNDICRHLLPHGAKGLAKSKLMEKGGVRSAERHQLDSALDWLVKAGKIANIGKPDAKGAPGRSGEKYRLTAFETG